ncbi:MAG: hypothetical protein NZ693_00580 [Thermoflexales bacterium]|nr:hypothetical protein [Thermoflexales bacterium]
MRQPTGYDLVVRNGHCIDGVLLPLSTELVRVAELERQCAEAAEQRAAELEAELARLRQQLGARS